MPLTCSEVWPIFAVRIRTPRLELRPVDTELGFALGNLAAEGIHDPAVMPFLAPWTDANPPELQRNTMRHYWETWSKFQVEDWSLPFAVLGVDDQGSRLVGTQSVHEARSFPVLRTFTTGSWVGRAFQRQGIGTEMREAVLHFMFAGLGAEEATTGAYRDNPASLAVTRSLGYHENGTRSLLRRGEPVTEQLFRLPRASWEQRRRDDITIEGLDERCLAFLGLAPDLTPLPAAGA
jgi:RimJ/RimL family protein N-acetyltransferase